MRTFTVGLGLVLVILTTSFLAMRPAPGFRVPHRPDRLPPSWMPNSKQSTAWIFVKPECRHCSAHLGALQRCIAAIPEPQRGLVLDRLRVVGADVQLPGAVEVLPGFWRDSLDIRFTPMTLWVEPDGTVRDAWLGARNERAWRRAFATWTPPTTGSL